MKVGIIGYGSDAVFDKTLEKRRQTTLKAQEVFKE